MKPFEEGFVTFEEENDDKRVMLLHKPTMFLSKGGYAIFNNGAMLAFVRACPGVKALKLGFNPHTKMLAIKPEAEHVGYPKTVRLSLVGEQKRTGQISFRSLAGLFDIQFTGRRYRLVFDKNKETGLVDLGHPMGVDEKNKRMRVRKTVSRKLEEKEDSA